MITVDFDSDENSMRRLHFVEVELGCQVHFHLESGTSYRFNVVVTCMTLCIFSCVGVIVKFHDLAVRKNLSSDAFKVIHGGSLREEYEGLGIRIWE